ncbi:MAG TPA: hypothetical protein VI248_24495 [Kineosporiaceae bacterium]
MQTRERAVDTTPAEARGGLAQGMRQAAVTALAALAGCALLIGVGAAMSICWTVHPLLTLVVGAAVVWLATRACGLVFRSGDARQH